MSKPSNVASEVSRLAGDPSVVAALFATAVVTALATSALLAPTGSGTGLSRGEAGLARLAAFEASLVRRLDDGTSSTAASEPRTRAARLAQPGALPRFLIPPYPMPGPLRWEALSPAAKDAFSLGGRVPVHSEMFLDRVEEPGVFNRSYMEHLVGKVGARDPDGSGVCIYGPDCDRAMFAALEAHPMEGKSVLVVGTLFPWLEAILLSHRVGKVTTVDFNKPVIEHPRVTTLTVPEFEASRETFDAVMSYSSLEHDGLGRYGDPLNPWGDFARVKKIKKLVNAGGKFYLGVPNGPDFLNFNGHRVYGPLRFPLLVKGWKLLGTYGEDLEKAYKGNFLSGTVLCFPKDLPARLGCFSQPVHVLSLKHS